LEDSFKEDKKNIDDENDNESLNIKVYKYILYDVYDHDVLIKKLNKKNRKHVDLAMTQANNKSIQTFILIYFFYMCILRKK